MKKRFGIIFVLLILLLMFFAVSCDKNAGAPINYNKEENLPAEANLIMLTDMKYDKSQKQYYISVKAGRAIEAKNGVEEIDEEIYIFALSNDEDFYALCWEPGADGLTSRGDYHSPNSFNSWWIQLKKIESGEEPFEFSFNENGQIDYLFAYYDLTGFTGYDD